MKILATIVFLMTVFYAEAQDSVQRFTMYEDVQVTIDGATDQDTKRPSLIILYALPNGNSTEQTMGKIMAEGEDWHFDIQHIKAQTKFLRQELPDNNIVVVYLENRYKSWPQWKTKHLHLLKKHNILWTPFFPYSKGKSHFT